VRRKPEGIDWRASWFELFFDVVFVLVVSQLSALLVAGYVVIAGPDVPLEPPVDRRVLIGSARGLSPNLSGPSSSHRIPSS
jgi:hypothetical protein